MEHNIVIARNPVEIPVGEEKLRVTPIGEGVFVFQFQHERKVVVIEGDQATVSLLPAYLDRPILLILDPPVELAPRGKGEVYVTLPMAVEVMLQEGEFRVPVFELTPPTIKKAWFGDMESGALVYAARSVWVENPEHQTLHTYEVLLPLTFQNLDKDSFDLQQLLIDSHQLSIYETEKGQRVSEMVKVTIREDRLEIWYTDQQPKLARRELRKGEMSAHLSGMERLAKRTFSRWKKLLRPFDAFGN